MPSQKQNRLILRLAVVISLLTAIITQAFVQFAGGAREQTVQLNGGFGLSFLPNEFDGGLAPYISSGAIFQPEGSIFMISFIILGGMLTYLSRTIHSKTKEQLAQEPHTGFSEHKFLAGPIAGLCLIGVALFPMHSDLLYHVIFAFAMFTSYLLYAIFMTKAREELDSGRKWFGYQLTSSRNLMVAFAGIAIAICGLGFIIGNHLISAIFEWILFINLNGLLFSFEIVFDEEVGE